MSGITDSFFLCPRELFSGERIGIFDAINLVIYAKVPLVEVKSGRDLVAGYVQREEPNVNALISTSEQHQILEKYDKEIRPLRFPVSPAQYQPLLERMLEEGETALPYFYQEHHQTEDRRRRIGMFLTVYAELQRDFQNKLLVLQRTDSELTQIFASDAWMTLTNLHDFLERQGVAPWWHIKRNFASHDRLERILFSDSVDLPKPNLTEGYECESVPSFVFASMLLKRARLFRSDGARASSDAAASGAAQAVYPQQIQLSDKAATTECMVDSDERTPNGTKSSDLRTIKSSTIAQTPKANNAIEDAPEHKRVKRNQLQDTGAEYPNASKPILDGSMLTKRQVADELGVSPNTIDNYRKQRGFPQPIQYSPNTIRWDSRAIIAWKNSRG